MKKIIFLSWAMCMWHALAQAQISLYDDIDLGPVANDLGFLPNPNWGITHGTPSYSPTQLWMWSNQVNGSRSGEGIFRRLNFQDGANFQLSIGIVNYTNPIGAGQRFKVLLANDPLPVNCGFTGCPIPTFSGARELYTYTGGSFDNHMLTLRFSTGPSETYKYLVIYPEQTTNAPQSTTTHLTVTCLTAYSCAVGDKVYCSGAIPSGTSYYKNIYAGSSFCGLSPFVYSNATANTRLLGTEKIILQPNTNITMASGSTFIMEIEPCVSLMGNIPTNTVEATLTPQANLCSASFANDQQWNPLISPSDKEMKIFPNPSSGVFNFSFGEPLSADATITISSAEGRVIKEERISGTTATIDLSKFSNGIYFVKIINGANVMMKKIIKQ